VKVSIVDEGVGIPEEHLSKIFDPYFTTKQCGSGLGLAATYGVIQRHRGTIEVSSKVGTGTCVCVYLPVAAAAEGREGEAEMDRRPDEELRVLPFPTCDGLAAATAAAFVAAAAMAQGDT
jgi:hypothetical protein